MKIVNGILMKYKIVEQSNGLNEKKYYVYYKEHWWTRWILSKDIFFLLGKGFNPLLNRIGLDNLSEAKEFLRQLKEDNDILNKRSKIKTKVVG